MLSVQGWSIHLITLDHSHSPEALNTSALICGYLWLCVGMTGPWETPMKPNNFLRTGIDLSKWLHRLSHTASRCLIIVSLTISALCFVKWILYHFQSKFIGSVETCKERRQITYLYRIIFATSAVRQLSFPLQMYRHGKDLTHRICPGRRGWDCSEGRCEIALHWSHRLT